MCGTLDESGSETHLNRAPWSLGSGNASVFYVYVWRLELMGA